MMDFRQLRALTFSNQIDEVSHSLMGAKKQKTVAVAFNK